MVIDLVWISFLIGFYVLVLFLSDSNYLSRVAD